MKVVKNKVAPPFRMAVFDILYAEGISRASEIITLGVDQGFIDKAGAWYSYNGDRIGQGKENVRQFLIDHPEISDEIEAKIRAKLLPPKKATQNGAAEKAPKQAATKKQKEKETA